VKGKELLPEAQPVEEGSCGMRRGLAKRVCALLFGGGLLLGAAACLPVDAVFIANPIGGPPPLEVTFDASASTPENAIRLYEWDFGDGTQGEGVIVDHTYTQLGEYWVELHCHSRDGAEYDSSHRRKVVCTDGPDVAFNATPTTGDAPLRVLFDDEETTPPAEARYGITFWGPKRERHVIQTVLWDFGDGLTTTWENDLVAQIVQIFPPPSPLVVDHTYSAPGTYNVTLTVTDSFGLTGAAERQVIVGGSGPDPIPGVTEDFTIVSGFWQVTDEEDDPEQECLDIWGDVRNDGPEAGCELSATAYDATGNPVGSIKNWPAADTNIRSGGTQPFSFFLCDFAVLPSQVARVDIVVSGVTVW